MSMEHDYIQNVVIGVGINVREQQFSPEIADKASSLDKESGLKISRCALIGDICEAFEKYYDLFLQKENLSLLLDRYNGMLVNMDREVCVLDPKGEYTGVARGINAEGELLVETGDGEVRQVYAGEVSVRGIYGYT
jgi:BirA family biotin operon repressor/biotin-[acetyl-CoA-carboxylase] ligase